MPIITLTSDWGTKDHYVAAVKGSITSQIPDAVIVDITHDIKPFDIISASYVIKNSYPHFPQGTIHLIGVNTEASLEHSHIAVFHDGHYFIGTDNGIFSLVFNEIPKEIIEIDIIQDTDLFTFPSKDVFVKVASQIIKTKSLEGLGNKKKGLFEKKLLEPVVLNGIIKGSVIYIDRYENIITNITSQIFKEFVKSRPFKIKFRSMAYVIKKISQSYGDVEPGEKLAVFGSAGYLEIAINQGKAASLLGLETNDSVNVIIEE
ncbi:MAG: SAM-dependent chlorinase/fluorinase [Bacteroidales bacterium]|nr:SAM-dependent chlorinase/fluorinase [Bacteroidales bacterium]